MKDGPGGWDREVNASTIHSEVAIQGEGEKTGEGSSVLDMELSGHRQRHLSPT